MNISHFEVEVTVRCIDKYNNPINTSTHIMSSNNLERTGRWIKDNVGQNALDAFVKQAAEALQKPEHEETKPTPTVPDSNPELPKPEAEGKGVDAGVQPTLFGEGP